MIAVDATCPINWQHPLNRGLAAWWLAGVQGRTGGAKWYDLAHGRHGTLTNMDHKTDWVSVSRIGGYGAVDFDGTDDRIVTPDFLGGPSALSAAAWVKFSTATLATFVGQYNATGNQRGWLLGEFTTGELNVIVSADGTYTNADDYITSFTINSGTWRHVAFVFIANTLKLFVDGVEASVTVRRESTVNSIVNSTQDVALGSLSAGGNYYQGQLDDVRIWTRALSAQEVRAYYDLSRQGYPGLLNRADRIIGYVPPAPPAGHLHINLSGNLQSLVGGMQN